MYAENERMAMLKHLDVFGLNPFAFWKMFESYLEFVHPMPVKFDYIMKQKDNIMDGKAKSKSMVELYLEPVGYYSKKRGNPMVLDQVCSNLFCRSYYEQMRPKPVTFQIANAVTVHLRTPGAPEDNALNPLKEYYDPTK